MAVLVNNNIENIMLKNVMHGFRLPLEPFIVEVRWADLEPGSVIGYGAK